MNQAPRRTVSRMAAVATNNTPANTAPVALPPSTEATSDMRYAISATANARMPAFLLCIPWFPCQPRPCSAWIHRPDLDDGFLIVVGVGGRPAGSGRVCPAGLPAYPRGPLSWAVWGWGSGEHHDGVDAAAAPGQRCLPGPVLG